MANLIVADSLPETTLLSVGDCVKLSNGREEVWIELIRVNGQNLKGMVINELVGTPTHQLGEYGYGLSENMCSTSSKLILTESIIH